MADIICNISKGRTVEFYNRIKSNDPANAAFVIVLLQVTEADATLKDYADLGSLLAGANTEATFTNYARKTLTDAELDALPAPNNTTDTYDLDMPDQTYTAAGGATNNNLAKAVICYDSDTTSGTDANILPIGAYDWSPVTDGSDLILKVNASGFFSAS